MDLDNLVIKEGTVNCLTELIDVTQKGLWDLEIKKAYVCLGNKSQVAEV